MTIVTWTGTECEHGYTIRVGTLGGIRVVGAGGRRLRGRGLVDEEASRWHVLGTGVLENIVVEQAVEIMNAIEAQVALPEDD